MKLSNSTAKIQITFAVVSVTRGIARTATNGIATGSNIFVRK